jgi:prevent-host-death family protein
MGNIMGMKTISVPIGEARSELCALVKKVESGMKVVLTSYGEPKAMIVPFPTQARPWRVEKPDDASRYGDLQTPVMEPWA